MATTQPKIILSAEDRTAAAFAAVGRNVDKLGFNLGTLKGAAVGALGALAVPVSAGAIVALVNESRKAIDEIKDLSEATGTSVESFSALDKIARSVGAEVGTAGSALVKFNAVLKDADPTKGPGAVLQALNLDIEELKRLDPAEAMLKTAQALETWADDGNRARAVQELFGKSVKEAGPFLRDLAEAGKLNATITTQQAEEVERFNKSWSKLSSDVTDASRSMSISVIEELNSIIEKFRSAQKENRSFWRVFFLTPEEMAAKNKRTGAFQEGSQSTSGIIVNEGDQGVNELAKLARGAPPKLSLKVGGGGGGGGGGRAGSASAAPRDPYAEANRYLDSLRKQRQSTEELTVYEKLLADIRDGSIGKLTPQLQAQLEATAKQIDADKEINAITKEFAELNKQAAKAQADLQQEARGFFEATRTPIERLNIELARQDELLRKLGPSYKDTYMRAQEAAQDRYEAETKVEEKISELDQFTQRAAQNMQDYLGNSFQQIMEGNFDNIGDAFVSMLNNMVAQAAAAKLATHLFGKDGKGGGIASDFLGSIGNAIFSGFRAEGGPVQSGKGYIVGERGPEWFEPATSGQVVPNHALGGQTIQVSNVFHLSGPVDRRTQQQVAASAGRGVQMALARNG